MRRKNLAALFAFSALLTLGTGGALWAQGSESEAKQTASADVKVGLGIEKAEITKASDHFQIAPDTKIYAWARVSGLENEKVTFAFIKGDKTVSKVELSVPKSPHRTNAYRTFRKNDTGDWVVKVLGPSGDVLGSSSFKVEIK